MTNAVNGHVWCSAGDCWLYSVGSWPDFSRSDTLILLNTDWWPASCSSGQGFWLLIMRSRVLFPVLYENFSLQGKIPVVTMVWVVSRFRLKAPPGSSSSCISPRTSSGQRSRASWASQPQKSSTLSPQPGGRTTKVHKNMWCVEEKVVGFQDGVCISRTFSGKQNYLEECSSIGQRMTSLG